MSATRSAFAASTSNGILPAPWTASMWNRRLRVLRLDRRADRVDVLDDTDLVVREHDR